MDRVWHAALRTGLAGLAAPLADEHRRNVPGSVRAERLAQHIDRGVGDVGRERLDVGGAHGDSLARLHLNAVPARLQREAHDPTDLAIEVRTGHERLQHHAAAILQADGLPLAENGGLRLAIRDAVGSGVDVSFGGTAARDEVGHDGIECLLRGIFLAACQLQGLGLDVQDGLYRRDNVVVARWSVAGFVDELVKPRKGSPSYSSTTRRRCGSCMVWMPMMPLRGLPVSLHARPSASS